MTKAKASALGGLRKLNVQRQDLDRREAELRQKAAGELGALMLGCGAEVLEPGDLKALLKAAIRLGVKPALERLSA